MKTLDDLGIVASNEPLSDYEKLVTTIGNLVTEELSEYVRNNVHNLGGLAQSVVYFPTGSLSFEVKADEYYAYQDEGVNGLANSHSSRFSFRVPWVTEKMMTSIKDAYGIKTDKLAYQISAYLKQQGIKPRNITETVIDKTLLNDIATLLEQMTGLQFEAKFNKLAE
jgi:hypothetical protein